LRGTTQTLRKILPRKSELMTTLRKQTAAWLFGLTALAIAAIAVSFLVLSDESPTDPAFIEAHLSESRNFDVAGARKENYSDQEIAAFIAKRNRSRFDRKWVRLLSIVGALYIVAVLGIIAITLQREANNPTQLKP